jgi:hypothetical protein
MPQIKGGLLEVMLIVYGLFASAYILLRVQIAFAISRTGGADLAGHQHQTKRLFNGVFLSLYCLSGRGRNDANSLGAVSTCCAGAFTLFRVQIAFAISRTGGADLACHRHQTKNPTSCEAGFYCLVPVAGLEPARF